MFQSSILAFKYIYFHQFRSLMLIGSVGIIIWLPAGLQKLIHESESLMNKRALSTPLIVGAQGSSADLVINTLYFRNDKTETIPAKTADKLQSLGYGMTIPIACMFSARNFPIVGTDPDYFSFRNMNIARGRSISYLGECALGSAVSEELGIGVGDSIISSPTNITDLAGVYPLKMTVVGVFEPTETPDDRAIFTDIKTNWVIMGLGHGHQDLTKNRDKDIVVERKENEVKAGAKLYMYNSVNADNMDSFHFHGNTDDYPISSVIVVPDDHKSETILLGKFASGMFTEQAVVPVRIVQDLLQSIFRIEKIFNTIFILVGAATLIILILIVTLSVRLRKNEIYTMFMLGSAKFKTVEIIGLEMLMLTAGSLIFAAFLYAGTGIFVNRFMDQILF
jgi:putative ABC transport system permease protein